MPRRCLRACCGLSSLVLGPVHHRCQLLRLRRVLLRLGVFRCRLCCAQPMKCGWLFSRICRTAALCVLVVFMLARAALLTVMRTMSSCWSVARKCLVRSVDGGVANLTQ